MATTKSPSKKNVVALSGKDEKIADQLETLRGDIAKLAETVKIQAKTSASQKTRAVKDVTAEKTEIAKARYDELTTKAEASIKDNPLTSIAIAVGAGMVLGALSRR
ncbi:glycine zipper domain-containing protein [Litorimonas haliclonae]|uniref:glycine zipper domain-containing protein n=1 Tax=Litorimonas haliclonae TaxID=2081977 RepID=UPI0039F13D5C